MKPVFLAAIYLGVCASGTAAAEPPAPLAARDLAAACAICHGTNGWSAGGLPNLAGQPKEYLVKQMRDFRDGKRPATIMHQIAKGYTDEQYDLLAGYFAAQKAR
jgi:sulfide dehydrogenase cytochrome subunit